MNQVSPRVFEAIAARTVLVLFEGDYSGVVKPDEHFIPLKKNGSNLPEVFAKLNDAEYVDAMAERAYCDVIGSGRYSYRSFVKMVDEAVEMAFQRIVSPAPNEQARQDDSREVASGSPAELTTRPIRAVLGVTQPTLEWDGSTLKVVAPLGRAWMQIPSPLRSSLYPLVRRVKRLLLRGRS